MAQFSIAFGITMRNEGGYANNPNDSGGETYMGIARNFWPKWSGWAAVDAAVAANPGAINAALGANANVQALVQSFYKSNFWNTESLDNINDQQVANQLFDTAVNMGTGIASAFLQEGVNTITPNTLVVDRVIGPQSIAAANAVNAQALYNAICALRKARYQAIIAANPSQAMFANSWYSRMPPYVNS